MNEALKNTQTREDLVKFIDRLINDINNNPDEWTGKTIRSYLESIQSWIEDMDGYYNNTKQKLPQNIDWNFIATLLYVGKIYE